MVVLCSLGSKNPKGTSAEPGCHGSTHWRGEKYGGRKPTWQQDQAIARLNELVRGGMDAAVLRPGAREVAKKLIAREEAKHSCPGAQKACIACVKRMCASWKAADVQAFISPSRSPTSSPPPRRQWDPLPRTTSLPPRNIATTVTAATRSATAWTDLAHPIVAAEVAFSLLTRPAEASAFFATSTATAAAWRSVWRGENTSALYFRQDGFQLDTSFLPQIRAMSKSLFELQKKERTLAAALKTEEAGHRKSKERLKAATAMKHGYKDGWAEEKTEREGAAADAELRAEENKELARMLRRAHRRGFRPDESSEPPDESSEPPEESSDSDAEDAEDEEAWADLEGVTLTLRALNPSGSWGLGCRWQACIAWIVVFSGCSTVKCVDLLVGVLRFAGAEVLNVPADTEAAAKNAIFVAQEMAMDRLAYDMAVVKMPSFAIPDEMPVVAVEEGCLANTKSEFKYPQHGSVTCGHGSREREEWIMKGARWGELDITDRNLFPEPERDSAAGRARWKRKYPARFWIKVDGTKDFGLQAQEVCLIGGPGLTSGHGSCTSRSLYIEKHHGIGGAAGTVLTVHRGIVSIRQRQLRLGLPRRYLLNPVDIRLAGTDNTGSMESQENGFAGAFATVRRPQEDCE